METEAVILPNNLFLVSHKDNHPGFEEHEGEYIMSEFILVNCPVYNWSVYNFQGIEKSQLA